MNELDEMDFGDLKPFLHLPWEVRERVGRPEIVLNTFAGFILLTSYIIQINYLLLPPPSIFKYEIQGV